jgi:hypothetical protein
MVNPTVVTMPGPGGDIPADCAATGTDHAVWPWTFQVLSVYGRRQVAQVRSGGAIGTTPSGSPGAVLHDKLCVWARHSPSGMAMVAMCRLIRGLCTVRSSRRLIGTTVAVVAALSIAGGVAASSTVVVRPGDVGTSWLTADTRTGGSVSLVTGPATPPLGIGSLQMTTTDASGSSNAKAQLFNYSYIGTPLASFDAISYSAYRSSSSTNSAAQTIGLNLEVDINGGAYVTGDFTTLAFEPVYQPGGVGAMLTNTWQTWDAYHVGDAVWWSSKTIPGVCAFTCFVSWSSILAANPNATILGGVGFNIGSGWAGMFTGNADALKVGVAGNTTTYNFEPNAPLTVTADNKSRAFGAADPAFTYVVSPSVVLTTPATCTAVGVTAASPVGGYPITCTGGALANYSITSYVDGLLTITAAPVEIVEGATATPTVAPTATPIERVAAATGTPARAATPPPTSANGNSSTGGDSTPLFALLICLAFGSLGLLAVEAQRRSIRR